MTKRILFFILLLTMIFSISTTAFAYTKSFYGTSPMYTFVDSDYMIWPISYDYYTYEYYYYSSPYYRLTKHTNDGTLNNAENIPLDQTMDNSSSYQHKTSPSGSYQEVGRINYYEWVRPSSLILPPEDIYFNGEKNDRMFSVTAGYGKVYYFWWLYVTEGWWGASRSYAAELQFTL